MNRRVWWDFILLLSVGVMIGHMVEPHFPIYGLALLIVLAHALWSFVAFLLSKSERLDK